MRFEECQWSMKTQYKETADGIQIYAPAGTDFFVNPEDGSIKADAPFLFREVEGDFILRAKVSHAFQSTFDACALLAMDHETLWAKACFEYSDLGWHAIVSVMTNGRSDDANGVNIADNAVWLQLARKGNVFAIHHSLDGNTFEMTRLCFLPMRPAIKVGLVAQSPLGSGGIRKFKHVSLEQRSLQDIRNGNQ